MGWNELLEIIFASAAGQVYGLVRGAVAFTIYGAHGLWVVIVRAFLVAIEWADEYWCDLGIADNALLRMAVSGAIGFILAVPVILLIAGALGLPQLALWFAGIVTFCLFVGLIADPDGNWDWPRFPGTGGQGGSGIPLNL